MEIKLLSSGYCTSHERISLNNGAYKAIKFAATYALLKHPTIGFVLFDTGYTTRFFEVTKKLPDAFYKYITPVFITEEQHAINKLKQLGINANDIKYIIISHFHADHIGGLKDFPNAKFICFKNGYKEAQTLLGWKAVKKGILKKLIPEDIENRTVFIDNCSIIKDDIFGEAFDIFEDKSVLGLRLPGHARGQLGVLINTAPHKTFLIADAAWHTKAITQNILPSKIIRVIIDSWSDYVNTLNKVQQYHKQNPNTLIIPCHCPEVFSKFIKEY